MTLASLSLVYVLGKGPYFNYVSMFLSIFDQLSTLVRVFTKVLIFCIEFWELFNLTRDLSQAEKKWYFVLTYCEKKLF